MHFNTLLWTLILMPVGFFAGLIDAFAGGGGLIAMPAILLSGMNPVFALGTNKLQASIGECAAVLEFMRKRQVNYKLLLWGLVAVAISSTVGAILLQFVQPRDLYRIIPLVLLGVLIDYLVRAKRRREGSSTTLVSHNPKLMILGGVIGLYNGFLGPGTGSIWAAMLMKFFKLNVRYATMYAKPLNLMGNFVALFVFIVSGKINYIVALAMGAGSFVGGKIGAYLVIHKNLRLLKYAFVAMIIVSTVITFMKFEFHVFM